jgi:glycosyltransferase involved in cell wall biosynthesis
MRLLVLAHDGEVNASTRLRILQYLPALSRAGIQASTIFVGRTDRVTSLGSQIDQALTEAEVVFVQRVVTKDIVRRLSESNVPVVFDVDDALHYIRQTQYHTAIDPHSLSDRIRNAYRAAVRGNKFYSSRKRHLDRILRLADLVIVGNDWLFNELRLDTTRGIVIPTSVWVDGTDCRVHRRRTPTAIGWIGVKDSLVYLRQLESVFRELHQKYRERVELRIVSSRAIQTPLPTIFDRWSLETEAEAVMRFDVGIMPLSDDPYSRGKCALKAVFCMSRGIPVVASPVGANSALIRHGENGLLASTPSEWVSNLSALIDDPQLRGRLGLQARKTIASHYSAAEVARMLPRLLLGAKDRKFTPSEPHRMTRPACLRTAIR